MKEIDAKGTYYKQLNEEIRDILRNGENEVHLKNVNGQRYIGGGLKVDSKIVIEGVPGNDLASFMDGLTIVVNSNGQDGIANTMNSGKVVIRGDAGDVLGYGMRGGKLFIKGNVGYRVGIHMKAYYDIRPLVIVGGSARDFLGEYMAGGVLIVLGMDGEDEVAGDFIGTGMHGGVIYLRGSVEDYQLGKEVGVEEPTYEEKEEIRGYLEEFCIDVGMDLKDVLSEDFVKLTPKSSRPYGNLYAY